MDKLSLDEFVGQFTPDSSDGIHKMVTACILTNKNDCCGTKMCLVQKRKKWTWQCYTCLSTKSVLRQSFFEVWHDEITFHEAK